MLSFVLLILPTVILWPKALPVMASILLACGLLMELIQPAYGREGSPEDMMANIAGVLLGIMIASIIRKLAVQS